MGKNYTVVTLNNIKWGKSILNKYIVIKLLVKFIRYYYVFVKYRILIMKSNRAHFEPRMFINSHAVHLKRQLLIMNKALHML